MSGAPTLEELCSGCPASQARIKPFLTRALEFQAKQPVVAYFLKTYAAHLGVKNRNASDKEATKFVMSLLSHLEMDKQKSQVDQSDGRTALTRMALMLFSRADDLERSGVANESVVKMFFASSQLFEATKQFVDELDPIAAEKYKYARYVAGRMKKALDSGEPYVSHNPQEAAGASDPTDTGGEIPPHQATEPMQQQLPPSPPPPAQFQPQVQPQVRPQPQPQPQPQQPQRFAPQPEPSRPPPPQEPPHVPRAAPAPATQPTMWQPQYAAGSGAAPSMDVVLQAQKYAKQAVAALQFMDHANAILQLRKALEILEGGS